MEIHPFGKSEGAHEDFAKLIPFKNALAWQGLHLDTGDLQIRIVVGKKGSGKTFYLRIMEDYTIDRSDIMCFQAIQNRIDPNLVLRFANSLEDGIISSSWQTLWRRAFFLSLCTHFFSANAHHVVKEYCENSKSINNTVAEYRTQFFNDHEPRFKEFEFNSSLGIFGAASFLANMINDSESFHEIVNTPRWNQLETFIAEFLSRVPTVAYFLDAIDQDFRHAPAAYLDCQKGLYYAVRELLDVNVFRNKLHIVITIRDLVFSAVCFSEHKSKQFSDSHIRAMNWNEDSASYFFDQKLVQVHKNHGKIYAIKDFFISPNSQNEISAWLGFDTVENTERNVTESAKNYIVRHTHAMPRELVVICNQVSIEIARSLELKQEFTQTRFKRVVNNISSDFSEELLKVCANFIASSSVTKQFLFDSFDPKESFETIASDHYYNMLIEFIEGIGQDTCSFDDLLQKLAKHQSEIQQGAEKTKYHLHRIENVLWQQGLIGFRESLDQGKTTIDHFYTDDIFNTDFFLPANKELYVFHPGLIGLTSIDPSGDRPVGGHWRR